MSTGTLEEEKLQRYFDGDLGPDEEAEVRAALDASEDDRRRLVALETLGDLLRAHVSDAPDAVGDDLFARIQAGIAEGANEPESAEPARGDEAPGPGLRVIEGSKPESIPPSRPEMWKVWIPGGAALAAAAAVLIVVISSNDGTDGTPRVEIAPNVQVEEPGVTLVEAPQGSEVVEVDFGQNIGTVFEVEGDAGEPIAVVWISDEDLGAELGHEPSNTERVQ